MKKNQKVAFTFSDITQEVRDMTPNDRTTEIDVIMLGEWQSPWYGKVEVTPSTLQEIVANFKNNTRGIDIAIDYGHANEGEAAGWVQDLYIVGDRVKALVSWTVEAYQSLRDGEYRYFSPEVVLEEGEVDPVTGNIVRNILVGGGITNRPFFKGLQALKASELANKDENGRNSLFFNPACMKKFSEIKEALSPLSKITAEQFAEASLSFSELSTEEQETAKADLDSLETKIDTETPSEEAPKEEEKEEKTPEVPEEKKPEEETPKEETPEGAKTFSEASVAKLFSEFGVKSVEELSKKFHEIQAEKIATTRKQEVAAMTFSESNKSAPFLEKATPALLAFHEKFGALAFSEMTKIVQKSNIAPSALIFSEVGKGGTVNEDISADPTETIARKAFSEAPDGTSPKANAIFEVAKAFAEKSGKQFSAHTSEAAKFVEGLNLEQ